MITRSDITDALDAAGITFSLVEHEEARTTAEADAFIEGYRAYGRRACSWSTASARRGTC